MQGFIRVIHYFECYQFGVIFPLEIKLLDNLLLFPNSNFFLLFLGQQYLLLLDQNLTLLVNEWMVLVSIRPHDPHGCHWVQILHLFYNCWLALHYFS